MFNRLIYLIICLMLLSACTKSDDKINNEVKQEEDKKEQDKVEIDVNNLIDDINSTEVKNAIRSMFFDHEKYLIKKLDRGFTLIVIGKQDNGEYFSNLYDNIFLSSKGFVKLRKYIPDKKYQKNNVGRILEAPRQTETAGGKAQRVSGRFAAGNTPPHRAGDARRLRGACPLYLRQSRL